MRYLVALFVLTGCFSMPSEGPDPARNFIPSEIKDSEILGHHSQWPSHCPPEQHQQGWC